ncbi:hypothetical protein V1272_001223 [Bradyrhizobium sp. AZCC 1708]
MAHARVRVSSAISNGMPPAGLVGIERVLYESGNGDVWALTRDPASKTPVVKHQPNVNSGGQISYSDIGRFLLDGTGGPEHRALLKLIGTLLDD